MQVHFCTLLGADCRGSKGQSEAGGSVSTWPLYLELKMDTRTASCAAVTVRLQTSGSLVTARSASAPKGNIKGASRIEQRPSWRRGAIYALL